MDNTETSEEIISVDHVSKLREREREVRHKTDTLKLNYSLAIVLAVTACLLLVYMHAYFVERPLPDGHMVLMSTIVGAVVGYLFGENRRAKSD